MREEIASEHTDWHRLTKGWILHPCLFVCLSCPHTIYSPISCSSTAQIVLKPLLWPKDSNDVLRFEIAWWKVGQKVEQTDKRTQIDQGWILHPCLFVCLSCPYTIYSPIFGPSIMQLVLKPPPWPKDSNDVLRFEIAWWKVGQKVEQTDKWTQVDLRYNFCYNSGTICVNPQTISYPVLV